MLLGMVALARRDLVAAHEHLLVALRSRMSHGFHLGRACDTVNAIAVRCALGGDPVTAARLFGAAQATRASLRATPGHLRPVLAGAAGGVAPGARRRRLRRRVRRRAVSWRLEEAAALALSVEHPDLARGLARFASTGAGAPLARPPSRVQPPAGSPGHAPDPERA